MTAVTAEERIPYLTKGDWNAFFGYGSNLLVNVLTLTGMLKFVLGMPTEFIFDRVLPALGVMLFLSSAYYAWMAYDLARRTGRRDVCALPSGPGVGHIFIVVLVVMLPIKIMTGDYVRAWEAGMAWVFIQGIVIIFGGLAGQWIRQITPRAALLSALAGIAITYIAVKPISEIFLTPVIGLVCLAVVLLDWFGGVRIFGRVPAGLAVLVIGAAVAWGSNLVGLNYGGLTVTGVAQSLTEFGFRVPIPAVGHVFSGFEFLGILLVTAIPFGIYDIVEAIDNVESAASAGDDYSTNRVLVADGVISIIGAMLGNPFMLIVYIGHAGWKAMGGRAAYSFMAGLMILAVCLFGIVPVVLAVVPIVAVYPILLFISMVIGAQAFRETPASHAPAVIIGIIPHLVHWAQELVRNTLTAAGVKDVTPEMVSALGQQGILYEAFEVLGSGAVLTGIVLSATTVFVIENRLKSAAICCALGATFTWFGLMHSKQIGLGMSPVLVVTYLLLAAVMLVGSFRPVVRPMQVHKEDLDAAEAP
jgi:AGZA family xanthine/uracil permease-like MFS transporter